MTAGTGNLTEFCGLQGWSKSYGSKLKSQDRLVFTADGLVDFAASLARIKATSGAPERAAPPVQGEAYANAQDRERFYSAELKRLELERETGKLLQADEVHALASETGAMIRATVEGWRARLVPQLASIGGDEPRIGALLAAECEALLARLAQKFAAAAG